jgi:ABC-type transport system substrate-binding protein
MSDVSYPDVFASIQNYLGAVGIDVKLQPTDPGQFFQDSADGWRGLRYYGIPGVSTADQDPGSTLSAFLSDTSSHFSPTSLYIPPAYTAKLAEANAERDPEKRKLLFGELQKIAIDEYCMIIPNFLWTTVLGSNDKVHDLGLGEYNGWAPEKVWLSK